MALLDAALAFALTLAALATVVTIIMEIVIRALGLRKKDQVEVIKRLYDKVLSKDTGWKAEDVVQRWKVVRQVLENPFAKRRMKDREGDQRYWGMASSGIYGDVSLEHVLRRFIEFEEIEKAYQGADQKLKAQLTALSQKYEEYSSAIGAQFADNARWWSLVFGVVLALVMNVDGVRLFQSYLDSPERAALIIAQMGPILDNVEEAQKKLDEAVAAGVDQQAIDDLDAAVKRTAQQLTAIQELDLPVGQLFYPHCWLVGTWDLREKLADPLCQNESRTRPDDTEEMIRQQLGNFFTWFWSHWYDFAFLTWLAKVLVTGLLIGLGAPFWYDVAKRLAQVRLAFGGKGSAVQQHSGSDGTAKQDESKDQLIDRIMKGREVEQAAQEEAQAGGAAPQAEG